MRVWSIPSLPRAIGQLRYSGLVLWFRQVPPRTENRKRGSVMGAELVADCPRCNTKKITFDLAGENYLSTQYSWKHWYEGFCICRHCGKATTFTLGVSDSHVAAHIRAEGLLKISGPVNLYMDITGYISLKDAASVPPPEHLPESIKAAFNEAARCAAVGCHNAAGTMFRLAIDLATSTMLPAPDVNAPGLNAKVRRDLGLRLPWMFDNKLLPEALRELSSCVKDDGNDGAHRGTLKKEDADDLLDFATRLLERLYTEPERLQIAKLRREERNKTR